MRRFLIPFAAAALLLPAATASAQRASTYTAADGAAEARINAAMETAVQAGVPQVLLENKVAEGRAKGVAAVRIAEAVEHRAEVLTRVRAALVAGARERGEAGNGGNAGARANASANARANAGLDSDAGLLTAAELTAAADAHEAGVSLGNLVSLSARAGEQRGTALSVLAELVASGRVPEQALLNVQAALNRGGNALVELRGTAGAGARPAVPAAPRGRPGAGAGAGAAATGVVRVGGGN